MLLKKIFSLFSIYVRLLPRVGRAQLYRLSLVDAHTVVQNQYMGQQIWQYSLFFVMALYYVQKCELSYNVLGITQNCIPPSEIIIPNRECAIRLGIDEGANVIFEQVSHTISRLLHFCNCSVLLWSNCVTFCNVLRIMHCLSLAILSQLSRFHPSAVGTNWPILCWRAVKHQTNKQTFDIILHYFISYKSIYII